jgi:hypothetical protein
MGLFGGETIYVSSVVYNMAGDLTARPDYLKTTVVSNVIGQSKFSMSETLSSSYLNGPGIKIRSWHRWCKFPGRYDEVGVPYSRVADESDLTPYAVASHIPTDEGWDPATYYVSVATYKYAKFDYHEFAQKFMLQYHYSIYGEAWTSDFNPTTNVVTITRADGTTTFTFTIPTGTYSQAVDGDAYYIYSFYNVRLVSDESWVATRKYIYKIGTGHSDLDELVTITTDTSDEFLAIIPIRFKGNFISDSYKPDVWAQTQKSYKKLTGGQKLSKLVEQIAENEDIDDIDHAFIMHGVSVNTQEKRSKLYLAHFFERMMTIDPTSQAAYDAMGAIEAAYQADLQAWRESRATWNDEHPGVPVPPPPVKPAVLVPTTSLTISSKIGTDNTDLCDITLKWKSTQKTTGTGLGKPGALPQDVWWDPVTVNSYGDEVATLWWQTGEATWTKYQIIGLHFINEIYKGEAFKLGIKDALTPDSEYTESPFIVPIHYDTLKSMPLVWSTQVMCSSTYLVFNCYEVVKQKWYETGIFKIVVFAVMIAITVATGGAGAIGLLGTAGSVGASLGFTGLMATIVGAVANALAAMILMQIISWASVKIFGAKLGMIIATIASVAAMTVGTSMMNGMSFSAAWGNMMSAANLLKLTNSAIGAVGGYIQASTAEIMQKTADMMNEHEKAMNDVQKQYIETFGLGAFWFDPNQLTDNNPGGTVEMPQSFLDRTLMTGSDIADMSMNMISDFASLTLEPKTL